MLLFLQSLTLSNVQLLMAIAAILVIWLSGIALIAFRIGRFEAKTTEKMINLDDGRKENRQAVERLETSLREDVKDLRKDMQDRLDGLFREIVRNAQ